MPFKWAHKKEFSRIICVSKHEYTRKNKKDKKKRIVEKSHKRGRNEAYSLKEIFSFQLVSDTMRRMSIVEKYHRVVDEVSHFSGARLVVVVKNQSVSNIQKILDFGAHIIAFNRIQEAMEKLPLLRGDFEVHCIGHLQTNKVKKAVSLFHVIESVDSVLLAEKIGQEAEMSAKKMPVLLQVNTANDPKKYGFSEEELFSVLPEIQKISGIVVQGLMTIGKQNAKEEEFRNTFQKLRGIFEKIRAKGDFGEAFREISMGMSGDYSVALEEGATLVRVGSLLFSSV